MATAFGPATSMRYSCPDDRRDVSHVPRFDDEHSGVVGISRTLGAPLDE
jgi:hypothetical protein